MRGVPRLCQPCGPAASTAGTAVAHPAQRVWRLKTLRDGAHFLRNKGGRVRLARYRRRGADEFSYSLLLGTDFGVDQDDLSSRLSETQFRAGQPAAFIGELGIENHQVGIEVGRETARFNAAGGLMHFPAAPLERVPVTRSL